METLNISDSAFIASASRESLELSSESVSRIGTGTPRNRSSVVLTVHVPLNAQIVRIQGFLRNSAWPDGCDLGNASWHAANLYEYHEPIGWAYAGHVKKGTTRNSQWVSAVFVNWSHCNPRFGKLVVFYKLPETEEASVEVIETTENLQTRL